MGFHLEFKGAERDINESVSAMMPVSDRQNNHALPMHATQAAGTEKPNKVYKKQRFCMVCEVSISMYNKHKTCWAHTPKEKFLIRGKRAKK